MSENTKIRLKVENCARSKRVGLVASSLEEVIQKAKSLGLVNDDATCSVVLGSDTSTEIADDDYLLALEPDTTVIILSDLQQSISGAERIPVDERDSGSGEKLSWLNVLKRIAGNVGYIGLLTQEELELVAEEDDLWSLVDGNPDLCRLWSRQELEEIQDRCQKLLDSKRRVNEAVQLVQLYQKYSDSNQTVKDLDKALRPKGI